MGRPKKIVEEEVSQPIAEAVSTEVKQEGPQDPITITLESLIGNAQKLLKWTGTDRDFVKRCKNESRFLNQKNQSIAEGIRLQETYLENLKTQGLTIISDAKRGAEMIKQAADDVLARAHQYEAQQKKNKEDSERELSLARMKAREMVA